MKIIACSFLFVAALSGQWWPPAVNLGIPGFDDINPQACRMQSQYICLVWQSYYGGNWDVFSRILNNTTWSDTIRMTSDAAADCNPSVAYDPYRGCFWCVWQNDSAGFWDILVSQGTTTGQWSMPIQLTSDTFPDVSPTVCVIGNNVWVAWQRDTADRAVNIYSVYYNGDTWSPPMRVTDDVTLDNTNPKINLRVDHPFLVWEKNRDIYYSECISNSWSSPQAITTDPASDSLPEIATGSPYQNGVWVYWQSNRDGNWEIYRTGLDTFSINHRVTVNDSADVEPSPIHGMVPIRFTDALLVTTSSKRNGNYDIFGKYFWSDSFYNVDTNRAQDILPVATADFHVYIWILWQTDRNVDWDICGSFYLAGGTEEESGNKYLKTINAHPNPFRDHTIIRFTIQDSGSMNKNLYLMIYDITGRLVKDLSVNLGSCIMNHASVVTWPGTDQSGRPVPPGVYFVRTTTGNRTIQEKIIRLR